MSASEGFVHGSSITIGDVAIVCALQPWRAAGGELPELIDGTWMGKHGFAGFFMTAPLAADLWQLLIERFPYAPEVFQAWESEFPRHYEHELANYGELVDDISDGEGKEEDEDSDEEVEDLVIDYVDEEGRVVCLDDGEDPWMVSANPLYHLFLVP